MEVYFTKFDDDSNWVTGKCNDGLREYRFKAKLYDEGSYFGIDEGRVSKLLINTNSRNVVNYDRGWDVEPIYREEIEVYKAIMNLLESSPRRFD